MRRSARTGGIIALGLLAVLGCRAGGLPLLNLLGLDRPLVVALVAERTSDPADGPLAILNPFGPYEPLRAAMQKRLGRPVALELCFPFQLDPNLAVGFYHVAIVPSGEYARLAENVKVVPLAVSSDATGVAARPAVLIVARDAALRAAGDLRGKVVAFGPAQNGRTHLAALQFLESAGIAKAELSLELLPIPGSLKHFGDDRSIAQSVMNGSSAAGFVDAAYWDRLPSTALRDGDPARGPLREIGRTVAVPDCVVVAAPSVDESTRQRVRDVLLHLKQTDPEVLTSLGHGPFVEAAAAALAGCPRAAATTQPAP